MSLHFNFCNSISFLSRVLTATSVEFTLSLVHAVGLHYTILVLSYQRLFGTRGKRILLNDSEHLLCESSRYMCIIFIIIFILQTWIIQYMYTMCIEKNHSSQHFQLKFF
jgi:hypothetical protein